MTIMNKRNALLGWAALKLGMRVLRWKMRMRSRRRLLLR
jgi:hypothetical protein